jgi:hypothetical protein
MSKDELVDAIEKANRRQVWMASTHGRSARAYWTSSITRMSDELELDVSNRSPSRCTSETLAPSTPSTADTAGFTIRSRSSETVCCDRTIPAREANNCGSTPPSAVWLMSETSGRRRVGTARGGRRTRLRIRWPTDSRHDAAASPGTFGV